MAQSADAQCVIIFALRCRKKPVETVIRTEWISR